MPFLGGEVAPRETWQANCSQVRTSVGHSNAFEDGTISSRPFGSNATPGTVPGYGGNGLPKRLRERRSHRLEVASVEPTANVLPSGEKAT